MDAALLRVSRQKVKADVWRNTKVFSPILEVFLFGNMAIIAIMIIILSHVCINQPSVHNL